MRPDHYRISYACANGVWTGVHRIIETPPAPNGIAPTGLLEFLGDVADGTNWAEHAARITAPTLQAGTAPGYQQNTPWDGTLDGAVLGKGGGYYLGVNNDDGNVSTADIWARVVTRVVASKVIFAKRNAGVGYQIGFNDTPALYCTIQDASGSVTVVSGTLIAGAWMLGDIAINRDEASTDGGVAYVECTAGTGVDCSARALTLDADVALALLADSAGATPFTDLVAFIGLYWKQDWLQAGATGQADALEQHKRACAVLHCSWPMMGFNGVKYPTAKGSLDITEAAYQKKIAAGVASLHYMQPGVARFEHVEDSGGRIFTGACVEPPGENMQLHSEDLSLWTATTASVPATALVCPDGRTLTTVVIKEDATAAVAHYLSGATRSIVNGTVYTWSFYGQAINRDWLCVVLTGPGITRYFDLANGVVGATEVGTAEAWVEEPDFDGWFRCGLIWTAGSASTKPNLYVASADGTTTFNGANQDSLAVWGIQLEPNSYALSYIRTP